MGRHAPCFFPVGDRTFFHFDLVLEKVITNKVSFDFEREKQLHSELNLLETSQTLIPLTILPLKGSFAGKTGLIGSNSHDEDRFGKFEKLDSPSSVSDLIEFILLQFFIHFF